MSERILKFVSLLRSHNFDIGPGQLIDAHQLVESSLIFDRTWFQYGLRTTLCSCFEDWSKFDSLFTAFWSQYIGSIEELDYQHDEGDQADHEQSSPSQNPDNSSRLIGFAGTSSQQFDESIAGAGDFKALSLADFRFVFNPIEKQQIEKLVDELARRSRRRYLQRKVRSNKGSLLDTRRTIRQSLRYNGALVDLKYLKRQRKLPRFVLLLDVSQSMEVYAKLFLRFACKLMSVFNQSEVFAFNTDLVHLGSGVHRLSEEDLEAKFNNAERQWLGGTCIAASLERFDSEFASVSVTNQTIVMIFSDGCDTATPEELAQATRKLQTRARQLIWVNPLLGRFEPGEKDPNMDPVVPFIDNYTSAHNLQTLNNLQKVMLT